MDRREAGLDGGVSQEFSEGGVDGRRSGGHKTHSVDEGGREEDDDGHGHGAGYPDADALGADANADMDAGAGAGAGVNADIDADEEADRRKREREEHTDKRPLKPTKKASTFMHVITYLRRC